MRLYERGIKIFPERLQGDDYWYLATPYSKYPDGLEAAFEEACRVAGWLIANDVKVFSPISHTHPIALCADLDPLDHEIWLPADEPFMNGACGLIVAEMDSWQDSYGIGEEIKVFRNAKKPIIHLAPEHEADQ